LEVLSGAHLLSAGQMKLAHPISIMLNVRYPICQSSFHNLPRLQDSGINICKARLTHLALAETNAELDTLKRLQDAYPDTFDLSADSNAALTAAHSGKIASPLCVEGLHLIGNSTATLRHFYSLGVRYITLTHNCHNLYADAAMVDLAAGGSAAAKPYWHGISPAGRDVVREMNRL
jgi:microsomal dipeptidase-like Zn-dependent dipeptidase